MATAVVATAETEPQYMKALQRANKVRLERSELKQEVKSGERSAADVIMEVPRCSASMAIFDLLISQRRWGKTRVNKFLSQIPIPEKKTIGSLTERQRLKLVAHLFRYNTRLSFQ
jgi:hypothetical protein